jgi:hypothetical protein
MDVRVIITSRPDDDGCRVSVASPKSPGLLWQKEFASKHLCLAELRTLGLLTANEVVKGRAHFDKSSGMLIVHTDAEPEALIAANFVQKL